MTTRKLDQTEKIEPRVDLRSTRGRLFVRAAVLLAAVLIVQLILLTTGIAFHRGRVSAGCGKDFFVWFLQTRTASRGLNPYAFNANKVAYQEFKSASTDRNQADLDLGFYYPPQAMLVVLPFSRLPWHWAVIAWDVFQTCLGVVCGLSAWLIVAEPERRAWIGSLIVAALLLNPVVQTCLNLGQAGILVSSSLLLGLLAYQYARPIVGALCWACVMFKPHLGIPFVGLAWILGGWKRFAQVSVAIIVLNVLGCLLTTGSLSILWTYPSHVAGTALDVDYNRATNDQALGWNRLLYAFTGIEINVKLGLLTAGLALWTLVLAARVGFFKRRPRWDLPYALAAAAVGSLWFCQTKGYDMVVLVLLAPLVIRLFTESRRGEAWTILGLLAIASIPRALVLGAVHRLGFPPSLAAIAFSYRAFVVAALAAELLIGGVPLADHARMTDQVKPEPNPFINT